MSKNKPVGYGTIPTDIQSPKTFIARAKYHTEKFITRRRPWREFFDYTAITRPLSNDDAKRRIEENLNYFRVNYAMTILLILFLSLIYKPTSMITFMIVFVGWFFLYFFRDPQTPVIIHNQVLDDRVVLLALSFVTVFALACTDVGVILLVTIAVGAVVVMVHAAIRSTDDLAFDDQGSGDGDLVSVAEVQGSNPDITRFICCGLFW